MIFGIGIDVLEAERVAKSRARFGERFAERLLLPAERIQYGKTMRPDRFLAMRFAAKEAIVKAMGTGFAHGMWIRDCGVVQDARGKPEVVWSARGERLRRRLGIGEGHVTLTDEAGLVVAVAVLMRAAPKRKAAPLPRRRAARAARPARANGPKRTARRARPAP
jgi:holo-[acyl-carrier protein] synthase